MPCLVALLVTVSTLDQLVGRNRSTQTSHGYQSLKKRSITSIKHSMRFGLISNFESDSRPFLALTFFPSRDSHNQQDPRWIIEAKTAGER